MAGNRAADANDVSDHPPPHATSYHGDGGSVPCGTRPEALAREKEIEPTLFWAGAISHV
jgi:hypothetical protein